MKYEDMDESDIEAYRTVVGETLTFEMARLEETLATPEAVEAAIHRARNLRSTRRGLMARDHVQREVWVLAGNAVAAAHGNDAISVVNVMDVTLTLVDKSEFLESIKSNGLQR